jgi:aminocarboxymuconate-semialdehyde decarboxylase
MRTAVSQGYAHALPDGAYLYTGATPGYQARVPRSYVDLDLQLASMDEHGIDVALISANLLAAVDTLPASEAQAIVESLNEQIADAQREHGGRIAGLAMLPMGHPEQALETLDRAIGELGLRGVQLLSNIAGRPIFHEALLPVYRRIEELGVPIFLHPHNVSMLQGSGLDPVVDVGAGWMLDTTAAALTLVYRGVLDACPELVVVHPHAGGMLPFVRGRVQECAFGPDQPEHPLDWYLRNRFFVDAATDTPGALALAVQAYGAERIVFGSDWPWYPHEHSLRLLETHEDREEAESVLRRNRVPGLMLDRDERAAGA